MDPRWVSRIGGGMVAGLVLVLVVGGVIFGPLVQDDLALDRIVHAVVLDWRDFGEDTARSRLQYELDHEGLTPRVDVEACQLAVSPLGGRRVRCTWDVTLRVPGTQMRLPLRFRSEAAIDPDGSLAP